MGFWTHEWVKDVTVFKILGTCCDMVIQKGCARLHGQLLNLERDFQLVMSPVAH